MAHTLTVSRSLDRILTIGGKEYRLFAEDWGGNYHCEAAASLCATVVNQPSLEIVGDDIGFAVCLPIIEATLGIMARDRLGVDDSRPLGYAIILEQI